ncbi:MAG: discoidin domain-containing protein, partial [Clostridia bacterium]|nr:discoidin domain-containing protein [Clostridia bacterium]
VEDQFNIVTFMPYFWAEEVNPEYFDLLKQSGITNVELNFAFDANAITYENNLKAIALAYERGMDVTVSEVDFTNATWPSKTEKEIQDFVKKYSHLPGVTGFYIEDESANSAAYAKAMATIKEIMPYAVTHVNYCGQYADNVRALYKELAKYGDGLLDYVMYDLYCFRNEVCDENSMYTYLEYNRQIGRELNTPTAFYVQSMAWNNCYRPNGDDIRYQVWAGLAYGIKQYSYFCYHTPRANAAETYGPAIVDLEGKPTDLYAPVSELNWQIRAIGDTLMKLNTETVYHTGTKFGGGYNPLPMGYYLQPVDREQKLTISRMVEKETGHEYGIVVNRDYNSPQTLRFTLAEAVGSISYISTETGEAVPMTPDKDGIYTVELQAGEGVLLKLDEDYEYYLEEITDYYELNKTITAAEALDLTKYKPDGQEAFQKALAEAKTVAANAEATQAQVNAAYNTLTAAMKELRMKAAEGANLAQGMTATATSSYDEGTYFLTKFLTDGVYLPFDQSLNVGWSVNPFDVLAQDTTVDIIVDLEEAYLINAVILRPTLYNNGESFPKDYTVEVSTDRENWTVVGEGKDVTMATPLDQSYTVDSVEGRYVRIRITRHSDTVDATGGYLSQIGEIEVYGNDAPSDSETETETAVTEPVETDPTPDTNTDTDTDTDPTEDPTDGSIDGSSDGSPMDTLPGEITSEDITEPSRKGCTSSVMGLFSAFLTAIAAAWFMRRKESSVYNTDI